MRYLNALVFAGLILCGLVLLAGFMLGNGSLEAFAVYFGWFLCAYSSITYLVTSVRFSSKVGGTFWKSFYPINFGLALLAISLFGIHDHRTMIVAGATALVAAGVSVVLSRTHILDKRFTPVAALVLLGMAMIEPIFPAWKYLSVFVGVVLLVSAFIEFRLNASYQ